MIAFKFVVLVVAIVISGQAFFIQAHDKTSIDVLRDSKGNITDAELAAIKKYIQEAESQFNSTDFTRISKYVFTAMKNVSDDKKWNVYVHEGKINRIGLSSSWIKQNKYIILLNYGKYGITYTLFAVYATLCHPNQEVGGGAGTAQFGEALSPIDQERIVTVVDNSLIYKGDDIEEAAAYIQSKLLMAFKRGVWSTVIADPTARYGYYICRSLDERWFAFRAYKDLKWNYFSATQ